MVRKLPIPLVLLCLLPLAATANTSEPLFVGSLKLIAVDQTTEPFIYDGAYDVYHLVLDNPSLPDPNAFDFALPFTPAASSNPGILSGLSLFQESTDLPEALGVDIPHSFFVSSPTSTLSFLDFSTPPPGLHASYATIGSLFGFAAAAGDIGPTGDVVAVLTVEAGSPRPSLAAFTGTAFIPVFEPIGPGDPVPGDSNGDGVVDLLDLDIFGSELGALAGDVNGDGVFDTADLSVIAANFGQTQGVTTAAVDATEHPIFFPRDPNGDGRFDLVDLDILGQNFGATDLLGNTLAHGDLNGDRAVDLIDLDLLGQGFGFSSAITTPEPGAIGSLCTAMILAQAIRFKRK